MNFVLELFKIKKKKWIAYYQSHTSSRSELCWYQKNSRIQSKIEQFIYWRNHSDEIEIFQRRSYLMKIKNFYLSCDAFCLQSLKYSCFIQQHITYRQMTSVNVRIKLWKSRYVIIYKNFTILLYESLRCKNFNLILTIHASQSQKKRLMSCFIK